ncbi:MAG: peptidylprolyl isomerase [Paludibacter sp.]|nr:peptidylprolyl isomerase [Paludibacter sp.]MDD4198082.1 peptidylprolyl isomerase [Paludibacter sp.]MDD4427664.1 peptidylprolyl isomerase [Paludibacter sp.]
MKALFVSLSVLLISGSVMAKGKDPVLMTINGKPVLKSEFEYIYNKNNSNNALDKKTLEEYVDLFVNFKLKVEEAKSQGIDTTKSFINELSGYRDQLTKPYLTDSRVEESLLKEAYERMKEDIEVSHILVRVQQNAAPADTLKAWNKIQEVLKRLEKEDFPTVAKETSEDQSVEDNGGYIGWITGFRTVYPFETMAFNTPVGTISKPVRSAFGYHVIKVHNRRFSPGEVLVSHIMKFTSQGDDAGNTRAKNQIDSLYQLVKNGADFGQIASAHSEDRGSAARNGELPWFGTGRMVAEFEQAAFALKNTGDISEPVQSAYGWHIIKLLDTKPIPSFENKKADIERLVKRDERAQKGQQAFVEKLKKEYKLKINKGTQTEDFYALLQDRLLTDSAFLADADAAKLKKTMFSFARKKYKQEDFLAYLKKNQASEKSSAKEIIDQKLNAFIEKELLAYENTQLEKKYDDFRLLMQEYHDGILLFEVSNNEVWEKASKDTAGLVAFFKRNKQKYSWDKPHFKGRVIQCKTEDVWKKANEIVSVQPKDSIDKFLRQLNDSVVNIKIDKGLYVEGDNKFVDHYVFNSPGAVEKDAKYPYVFVPGTLLNYTPEDYTDVRGLVTADYQEFLEKEWINTLREKYPVKINQKVLKTVQKN